MAKTTKKATSKAKKTVTKSKKLDDAGIIFAATGILFAGSCVVLLGNIQEYENIQMLLVGFGSALLILGVVILALAIKPIKR